MALNIPMPEAPGTAFTEGVNTGSTLFSRIMQPILERERLKQAQNQFQQNYLLSQAKEKRQNSLLPYLMQQYKDRHATAGQQDAMFPLQRDLLRQQIQAASHKNDPMWELNQIKSMERAFGGGSSPSSSPSQSGSPLPMNNESVPEGSLYPTSPLAGNEPVPYDSEGSGKPPKGIAAPSIEQKSSPLTISPQPSAGGFNLEMFKQHPMLRGWVKRHYGIDPLAVDKGSALHGPARDAADLDKLKKEMGENSEVYQNAKAAYDANLDAKKDLRDLRARTKSGLKPGEKEFFDETTGAPLGKEVPLTEKERDIARGNILFNEFYPVVYKGGSPFSGEGSIRRLDQAAAHYKTDSKARELFDNLRLAQKALAAATVNEAATLGAGKTNRTYAMLKESLDAQDIPRVIRKLEEQYKIPASSQLQVSMRFQKLLSDARKKSLRETPATQKLFYNPEMQAQHEASKEQEASSGAAGGAPSGGTVRMKKDGRTFDIPTDKVNDALKEGLKHD